MTIEIVFVSVLSVISAIVVTLSLGNLTEEKIVREKIDL